MSEQSGPIRIERGVPTAEEVAALVAVLSARPVVAPATSEPVSAWWRSGLPAVTRPGAGAWRRSGLPA
ncbi:acyl-CoA carboxylase subunit epsilon [Catellatospora sp. KI3]|uniref:acyl-CoA carboxylase subunit epsilon n=1 Tax=Catellatospora sp. KI3 TaxID=3041620 RepID=UPI00248291A5|nr:acyl-CoA carboxylase subunit epsilon [Catellatospora sp. KI3]MDI1459919.1 acyl-CoA carboxylase subunit epsilon [Catellatospora sp. KI3]